MGSDEAAATLLLGSEISDHENVAYKNIYDL